MKARRAESRRGARPAEAMVPQVVPVLGDRVLPDSTEVVVIGGGIIGVSVALVLAERGIPVVLLEKGQIACEQSGRNWGWCRQARRDPRELELIRESLALWRGMSSRVGADTGFQAAGLLYAARDDRAASQYQDWVRRASESGIQADVIRGTDVARLLPGDLRPPPAALYCASDGRAEPQLATPAMAVAARRAGAVLLIDCAARRIETAAGRVASVATERGSIRCCAAVVAGGAWSRRILRDVGIALPQLKVRASVGRSSAVAGAPDVALWDEQFAFRRRIDGGYTIANGRTSVVPLTPDCIRLAVQFLPLLRIGAKDIKFTVDERFLKERREAKRVGANDVSPYECARTLDPAPDNSLLDAALAAVRARYPAFASARFVDTWAGFIDVTPDAVPVISEVDTIPGLVVATGFSGHGFGIAPAAGQLAADLVSGRPPLVPAREFRLSRFFDGSRPRPLAGI
jgi:glycine/D-amino acid oxidase-like deaminating enzyme